MSDLGQMGVKLEDVIRALTRLSRAPPDRRNEPRMGDDPAHEAGLQAVAGATDPSVRHDPSVSGETAHAAGTAAVDQAMDDYSVEAWKRRMQDARNAKRAGKAGEAAVSKAVEPTKAEQAAAAKFAADQEAAATKAWQERMAFDKQTKGMSEADRARAIIAAGQNYPAGYGPREGQLIAGAVGPPAVEGAIRPVPLLPAGFYPPSEVSPANQNRPFGDPGNAPNPFWNAQMPEGWPGHPDFDPGPLIKPTPMIPPGTTFGPHSVVDPTTESTQGYAPSSARAAHWGRDAVERELDKEPE